MEVQTITASNSEVCMMLRLYAVRYTGEWFQKESAHKELKKCYHGHAAINYDNYIYIAGKQSEWFFSLNFQ